VPPAIAPLIVVPISTFWACSTSVVWFFFIDFVQRADDEAARIADAPFIDQANVVGGRAGTGFVDGHRDLGDRRRLRRRALLGSGLAFRIRLGQRRHDRHAFDARMAENQSLRLFDFRARKADFENSRPTLPPVGVNAVKARHGPLVAIDDLGVGGIGKQHEGPDRDERGTQRKPSSHAFFSNRWPVERALNPSRMQKPAVQGGNSTNRKFNKVGPLAGRPPQQRPARRVYLS